MTLCKLDNRSLASHLSIMAFASLGLGLGLGAGCALEDDAISIPSWEEYKAMSTKTFEGKTIYVVEGDSPVTLEELRADYEARRERAERFNETGEAEDAIGSSQHASTVNQYGGQDDIWSAAAAKNLRYCVSDEFGGIKGRMVSEMDQATKDIEAHSGVDFIYVPGEDGNCHGGNYNVTFAVRPWNQGGGCAFFPSGGGCVARTVVMDVADLDNNYAPVTTLGVFRHELGHVIGLRHEHIRATGTYCTENTSWRALTGYDSASMMHYPWCPGGTQAGDLTLTALDRDGISQLYGGFLRGDTVPYDNAWCGPGAAMHTGDFNGDGRDDILCKGGDGTKWLDYAGANGELWGTDWYGQAGWCTHAGSQLHIGDFNGDGRDDMMCHDTNSGYKWVSLASASGTFGWTTYEGSPFGCDHNGAQLLLGDFNGDNRDDMLCHDTQTGRKWISFANSAGFFNGIDWEVGLGWCNHAGSQLRIGDFNGDGRDDMMCHDTNGSKWVALANASGVFTGTSWESAMGWCGSGTLSIGDFNGDGRDDMECQDIYHNTWISLASASGTFSGSQWYRASNFCSAGNSTVLAADFDGNGKADLMCHEYSPATRDVAYNEL